MTDRITVEWQTLKVLWKRVHHWFIASRDNSILPWKRRQNRQFAESAYDNFETQTEKMIGLLRKSGEIVIDGPEEIELKRRPRRNRKEAA